MVLVARRCLAPRALRARRGSEAATRENGQWAATSGKVLERGAEK